MADNKITIEIDVTGDGEARLKKLTGAVEDLGDTTEKALSKAGGAFEVFAGVLSAEALISGLEKLKEATLDFALTMLKEGVKAAQEQEDAINQLNLSLAAAGQFSKQASADMQEFAAGLQSTTKFADETVLGASALIENLGHLDKDGLKKATVAALDLSSALGIDLHAAALLVGKAASGEVASFSRYGLKIEEGATKAETFAKALDAINSRFGGAAAGAVNTYSGAVARLGNLYNDAQEGIGNAIIKNQSLINVIGEVGKILQEISKYLEDNKESMQALVSEGIIYFIDSLKLLVTGVQAAQVTFLKLEQAAVSAQGVLSAATDKLTLGFTDAGKRAQESADKVNALEKEIQSLQAGEGTLDKLQDGLTRIKQAAEDGVGKIADVGERTKNSLVKPVEELTEAQKKLIEQGEQLAQQAANKDPSKEFEGRLEALNAALEAGKIAEQDYASAVTTFNQEKNDKISEQNFKAVQDIMAENQLLATDDLFKNQDKIQRNNDTLREILRDEQLSTKDRIKIQQSFADQSKKIEDARGKAIGDSLNALATLQNAKTKEIAFVGKSAAIAQATIDTYRGASGAAAALAGIPIVGPALAAAAAAAFIAAGVARVAQISGVELATGLTEVPPGYSNDTFPARLSSGERVVDSDTNKDLKVFLASSGGMVQLLSGILTRLNQMEMRTTVNVGQKTIVDEVRRGIESGRTIDA